MYIVILMRLIYLAHGGKPAWKLMQLSGFAISRAQVAKMRIPLKYPEEIYFYIADRRRVFERNVSDLGKKERGAFAAFFSLVNSTCRGGAVQQS